MKKKPSFSADNSFPSEKQSYNYGKSYSLPSSNTTFSNPVFDESQKPVKLSLRKSKGTLFFDSLCSLLVVWGLLVVMQQLFRFEDNIGLALGRTILALGTIIVISRNKYTLMVTGITVALIAFFLWASSTPVINPILNFFSWWLNKFPTGSYLNKPSKIFLAQMIIAFAVSITAFFLIRVVRRYSVLLLLCIGAFGIILFNGFKNNFLGLILYSAGTFPVLAQEYQIHLYKKERVTQSSHLKIMAASTAVCLVAAILSGLLLPENTLKWQNKSLKKHIPSLVKNSVSRQLSATDVGLSLDPENLGGNIKLNKELVFEAVSKEAFLYRATHMNYYTGKGWAERNPLSSTFNNYEWEFLNSGSDIGAKRLLDYQWMSFEQMKAIKEEFQFLTNFQNPLYKYISEDNNDQNLLVKAINETMKQSATAVTMAVDSPLIYYPGEPQNIAISSDIDEVVVNAKSEISTSRGLYSKDYYNISFNAFNRNSEYFEDLVSLNKALKMMTGERDYMDFTQRSFPDSLNAAVELQNAPSVLVQRAIVEALKDAPEGGKSYPNYRDDAQAGDSLWYNDYIYATYIESYLKNNFLYTLSPGAVPESADFVDHFLETKKGYCVYFASTMAVMCRSIGIPSRFVIGYGVRKVGEDKWTANNDTAHAWVECYIQGIGWVSFDPTASSSFIEPPDAVDPAPTEGEKSTTKPFPSNFSGQSTTKPSTSKTSANPSDGSFLNGSARMIITVLVIALCLLVLILYFIFKRKSFDITYIRHKYNGDPNEISDHVYRLILKQFKLLKIEANEAHTMNEHQALIVTHITTDKKLSVDLPDDVVASIERIFEIMSICRYSEDKPEDQDITDLYQAYLTLDSYLKKKIFPLKFFFKKYFN